MRECDGIEVGDEDDLDPADDEGIPFAEGWMMLSAIVVIAFILIRRRDRISG